MPRPLRIEFENAQYHVMNRGAGRKNIFKTISQRKAFLELLDEAHQLFGIEINAYCLMSNHYHILITTPYANLSRAMKYINGIYTQRFNRLEKTDGPLFRGRYKAIIVSYDEYFLNASRYIHLNPVSAKITTTPQQFPWSSCRYFFDPEKKPSWLNIYNTLKLYPIKDPLRSYQEFLSMGIDTKTQKFYSTDHTSAIFSSNDFKNIILTSVEDKKRYDASADYNRTQLKYTQNTIISAC